MRAAAAGRLLSRLGGPEPLQAKFRGALIGALVGDALGAVFEGHPGLVSESALTELERGCATLRYTDDTA